MSTIFRLLPSKESPLHSRFGVLSGVLLSHAGHKDFSLRWPPTPSLPSTNTTYLPSFSLSLILPPSWKVLCFSARSLFPVLWLTPTFSVPLRLPISQHQPPPNPPTSRWHHLLLSGKTHPQGSQPSWWTQGASPISSPPAFSGTFHFWLPLLLIIHIFLPLHHFFWCFSGFKNLILKTKTPLLSSLCLLKVLPSFFHFSDILLQLFRLCLLFFTSYLLLTSLLSLHLCTGPTQAATSIHDTNAMDSFWFVLFLICDIWQHSVLWALPPFGNLCFPWYLWPLHHSHKSPVQFSRSVVSDSLRPHELQHAKPPCPTPTPGVYSNSRSLSRWCHPAISSSVVPFSSCPQSLPASGSFPMSQLFASGGQSTGVSALASVLPMNNPGLISLRMDWLDLLAAQGTLKGRLQHHSSKASIFWCSAFFTVQLSHPYMTTGKTIALTRWTFVGKVISLFFNMLSRLVITFLPRSKRLLISWLQSPSAVILEPQKNKFWNCFHGFSIYFPWSDGTRSKTSPLYLAIMSSSSPKSSP